MAYDPPNLAILGGRPRFGRKLYVGAPNLGSRQALLARIEDVLDKRWLTNNGQYVQAFEKRIKDHTGVRNCIAVTNATVGLQLVIRALGLSGEVILPSFTFVATAHALQWVGIRPVFCDIDPTTHTMDPDRIEELITPATTGIMGVHLWGQPCAPARLTAIAKKYGLELIFDAAHAFGCSSRQTMIGGFGRAEVFSFHATKFVNSLEGGAIVTNDDALAEKLRSMINFGFSGIDAVSCLGTNAKMNEFSACAGLTCLDSVSQILARNRENYLEYQQGLAHVAGIKMLAYDITNRSNYHYVVVELDEAASGLTRDEVVAALWADNVHARRYFYPGCHMMEPYRTVDPNAGAHLPNTISLCGRVMLLPNDMTISVDDVRSCCQLIKDITTNRANVRRAISGNMRGSAAPAPNIRMPEVV